MSGTMPSDATMYEPVHDLVITRPGPDVDVRRQLRFEDAEDFEIGARQMARVLASPSTGESYPRPPRDGDPLWFAVQYWCGLLHLLVYSLGWGQPGRGLYWWETDGGRRIDDLRLAVLHDVFERDGTLDILRAWLWNTTDDEFGGMWPILGEVTGWAPTPLDLPEQKVAWARRMSDDAWDLYHRESEPEPVANPVTLAGHLANYASGPVHPRTGPLRLERDESTRRAVLIVDTMTGWYSALSDCSQQLPGLDVRSWYVDVVVRSAGYLGTYRQSRTTKLWFSGRHRFHEPGV